VRGTDEANSVVPFEALAALGLSHARAKLLLS